MNTVAQNWAEYIASQSIMQHSQNHEYGENIYMRSESADLGIKAVNAWYNEMQFFHPSDNENTVVAKREMCKQLFFF